MAKVTTKNGRVSYQLNDHERQIWNDTVRNRYSASDNDALRSETERLGNEIYTALSTDFQDADTRMGTQQKINQYQNNLRRLGARGFDVGNALTAANGYRQAFGRQTYINNNFASQDEYDAAMQYSNDLAKLDLDAAQAEVGAWQQERENIANMSPEEITAYIEENKSWLPGYEEGVFYDFNHNILADYDSRITARQTYLNQIRNARQLSEMEQVIGQNDFAANSAFTGNRSLGVGSEADRTYLYINDPEYREDYSISRNMSGGAISAFDPAEIESISMMTDDERSIFNYYYNTQGEDAAMEYLDKLTSTIRQRRAAERFKELEGRTGAELAFGVAAGLDQFGSGIRSLLNTEDDYIAPSWRQYASGMVREDLQDARISRNSNAANSAGQVAYDTIVSGSNMLPSILASAAVGVLNPVAGQITGAVLMGASASGNAYQEMLNLGYSKAQARGYSALVGASEAGLSYLLSGISKLGGAIPGGITEAILKNVDNAFARVAIQLGMNSASEFTEEYLQEVLTPWFQNLALNAQNDVKLFTPEALYSGLLGALTAGLMEGVGTVSSAVQTRNTGRDFLGSTATLDDLKLLAELMPDNAEVQDLAERVNENSNAYTVGRFYEAVERGMPAQFKADLEATRTQVVDSLLTAGVTQKDADIIAGAVTGQMLGRKLTASQNRLLAKLSDTIPGINRIISESMKSNEMKRAAIRGELNTAVRGLANVKRSTETATEAATTAEEQTSPTTQTDAENGSQGDRRGTYSTAESLADEYDVTPSAIARIAQETTTQIDEKAFAESMRAVLAFTQETTLSREEAITALQKNVTTLNAQQIAEAVILGWDLRNAVSAEKQRAYDMGFAGQDIGDVLDSKRLSHLTEAQRREAFNEGAKAAEEAVTSGEKALPKTASVAYRKGSVRFDGDAKAISSKFKTTQRSAYIILERIAQLTGMDIVLYASKTDAQGNFIGEQGKFNSANPNEIRIDVNAGLNNVNDMRSLANYVMLRTFTHEFVHSFEVNARAQYRALKKAVFAEIRRNGKESVENLILIEQEKGGKKEDGSYKMSYDDASHEVLAQSLVDVLPQSTFIETLATQHRNIFEKLYAALKRFMRTIRHRFEQMTSAIPSEAAALKRDVDGSMQYAQHIVDLFDKAALATVETVQSRNMDSADAMNNTEAFEDSSVTIRNQIRPPYNENTKAFAEFADGLNAEAKETFDLFYNFYNLSRITNTTNAAGKHVKAINISAPFLRVDEWNAKISSDAKWGEAAARLAESLPVSVRENMHMNEDGSLTETPLEKEFKMQRSLAQRLVDSLPLEKIDAVYDIEGRKVELPAGKARQSVGGEAYRRAVISEVRKLFRDGRLKQVSIGTLSKDRWGSLGFLAANGKTGASGDFTTICPQMMFNRGCFYCYRRAALESGVNNKLVAERVWYAGEILRIKQKDIDALNENGGLRIQSFGDWMPHFSAMLADVLYDAELRGLQVKIITKEPSMIQYLAALRGQGLGNNLYFNLSADYAIEKAPAAANTAGSASLDHINPDRPFMRDEDKQMWWKRAMTVEEAGSLRAKYPWVNTRIVATDTEEFIRGLKDPTVDVVTGYHGNIRNYERIDSETGARKVEVEALGDAGMPRFVYENGEWVTEYEGKTSTHKQLAERIREENLFLEYYAKVCCQTGRCATCKGKCGQMARSLAMKNATNRDSKSRAYWQEHMSSAVEDISEASPEVDSLVAEFRQRMQNLSRNNENPTGKVRYQVRKVDGRDMYYVQADRQVLSGNDPDVWGKQIEKYINEVIREDQDVAIPTQDGHILLLTGRSSYKLADRHVSSIAKKVELILNDEEYAKKGRTVTHVDELIRVARFRKYRPDVDGKHENDIGADGFNYFETHFMDFDGSYYRIPLTAAINENGETAYSIGKPEKRRFPAGSGSSSNSEALNKGRKPSGNSIYTSEARSQEVKSAIQIAYEKALAKSDPTRSQRRENLTDRAVLERVDEIVGAVSDSGTVTGDTHGLEVDEVAAFKGKLTEGERDLLAIYTDRLAKLNDLQEQRREQGRIYRRFMADPNPNNRDRGEAAATKNRMDILDQQIERAMNSLREAERAKGYKSLLTKSRELVQQTERGRILTALQISREKRERSGQRRQRKDSIIRSAEELENLLNKGDKKRNVKKDMQGLAASAADLYNVLFNEEMNSPKYSKLFNERIVRNGFGVILSTKEATHAEEAKNILAKMEHGRTQELENQLAYRMGQLHDALERERERINSIKAGDVFQRIADEYNNLQNSGYGYIRGAFREDAYNHLLRLKDKVGTTAARNMTLAQLIDLDNAYRMVLTTIRKANNLFIDGQKQTVQQAGHRVIIEVVRKARANKLMADLGKLVSTFIWNNEKPIYAFERIGSDTLTDLFWNIRRGEDVWIVDVDEARAYRQAQAKKYGYDSWDTKKRYEFKSTDGAIFSLTLEQLMSLYAYSKREQAIDHLLKGGVVLAGAEVIVNGKRLVNDDATAYAIPADTLAKIGESLTADQRGYVDAMQDYLSRDMARKGNEVSNQLYGIDLFGEKNYFPINSSGIYNEKAEQQFRQKENGQISIVNSGFTKSTAPKASNPVRLSGFSDVWASHVNEMSMYHAFVLPLEDFRRVLNFQTTTENGTKGEGVVSAIQNAHGSAAVKYINQLLEDLNGGAVSDYREAGFKQMISKFKKAATMASLSVVVQQISSLPRAFTVIDPKYFSGKVNKQKYSSSLAELRKYAPIMRIKDMGHFDTGMGRSATEYINAREYTGKERLGAFFKDSGYRDEILGTLPAKVDEIAWVSIWEACKKELHAKYPKMSISSEEFLRAAGKRFTEVIVKTQVYDSTLAKSANMRSKSALMGMVTSFLAEPTVTANMFFNALRSKDSKVIGRTAGALLVSAIANNLLASLVYAMRDDDEDETYWEKSLQSFATGMLEDLNPLTWLPFLRDVWSILQGFDVQRADMNLISSVVDSLKSFVRTSASWSDDMTDEEKKEYWKEFGMSSLNIALTVANMFGIPLKNVAREVSAVHNTFEMVNDDVHGNARKMGEKIWDDVRTSTPILGWFPKANSKTDRLYDAIVSGDTGYQERAQLTYASEKSYENAVRKALRENDIRIEAAAKARMSGNLTEYVRLFREIENEGHFEFDTIMAAVNAAENALTPDEESVASESTHTLFTIGNYYTALAAGDETSAQLAYEELYQRKLAEGYLAGEARSSVENSLATQIGQAYRDGEISREKALELLTDNTEDHGEYDVAKWEFQMKYGFTWGSREREYRIGSISRDALIQEYMSIEGKTRAEAIEYVDELDFENRRGYDYSEIGDEYAAGNINRQQAASIFIEAGFTAEEAEEKLVVIDFEQEFSGTDGISYAAVTDYRTYCEPVGIGGKAFYDAWKTFNGIESSRDANGDVIEGQSKKDKALAYIDSLPYSSAQKDSLYLSFGYAESKLDEAPWH